MIVTGARRESRVTFDARQHPIARGDSAESGRFCWQTGFQAAGFG